MIALIRDLRKQRHAAVHFAIKGIILLILFAVSDRLLGLLLREGLDRYYGIGRPAAVLCVGHSHTVLGIDKVALEAGLNVPVAKCAVEGANAKDRLVIIRNFLARTTRPVKVIVYDVDAHIFSSEGLSSGSYQLLMPYMDNSDVRDYVRKSCGSAMEYWSRMVFACPRYNELTISLCLRGWLGYWGNLKYGTADVERIRASIASGDFRRITFDLEQKRAFDETVREVRERGIALVLVYIPTIDFLNRAEPEKHRKAMGLLRDYARHDPGVILLDYNSGYESRHELFYDAIHMNPAGRQEITTRLLEDLKRILDQRSSEQRELRIGVERNL